MLKSIVTCFWRGGRAQWKIWDIFVQSQRNNTFLNYSLSLYHLTFWNTSFYWQFLKIKIQKLDISWHLERKTQFFEMAQNFIKIFTMKFKPQQDIACLVPNWLSLSVFEITFYFPEYGQLKKIYQNKLKLLKENEKFT